MKRWTAVATLMLIAGCQLAPPVDPPAYQQVALTPDGPLYTLERTDTGVTIRNTSPDQGGNEREVFWTDSGSQTCATWSDAGGPFIQEGAALRIDGARALTVTKNVAFGATWGFNVHAWQGDGQIGDVLAMFDLGAVFRPDQQNVVPYPWRLCARIDGGTLTFKVWPVSQPEPEWGDPAYGGSVAVPAGYEEGGAGWYVGHVPPGGSAIFTDLTIQP